MLKRTLMCFLTSKTFYGGSKSGEDNHVRYEGTVPGEGTPTGGDVRRGSRNKKQFSFLSGDVSEYCGTSTPNSVHHLILSSTVTSLVT